MAVIGKIRQRAGLLIGIVGFSLVAFILGDLLTSNRSFLTGSGNELAIIGSKKVGVQEFESRVKQLEENYKINTGNETIDQNTLESLREQAWTQLLNEEILVKQIEKTGIKVSPEELFDLIQGKNPHPQIKEAFKDPKTGEFSPANVIQFLKNMDNDATGKTRTQWVAFEKYISEERAKEKYNEMIKHGLFTTSVEAKRFYENQNRIASVRFIDFNYTTIVDSTIQVDEKEMREYYNANQNEFKQEASRKLEYVAFEVTPSAEDRIAAYGSLEKIVQSFRESTDDSLFTNVNSDNKLGIAYFKQGSVAPAVDSVFFGGASTGTVVGPYEEGNVYKLSKLLEIKNVSDSIKVSHALIAFAGAERAPAEVTRSKDEAKLRADSLFAIVKKDGNRFDDIAKSLSDDKVASEKSGDLDWITQASPMDPKFKAGAFETPKGGVSLVESPFGFHIIKVTDQTAAVRQAKIATVDRRIEPGSKTFNSIYGKANEFGAKVKTAEAFDKMVKEQGLNKRVADNLKETDRYIPGLESPRALVQWAYQAKKGDVSKVYDFANKFVIAVLTDVKDKGIAPYDQALDLIKGKVITKKKAQMFMEKINAKSGSANNIDALAAALGVPVKSAETVNFNSSFVANLGVEPALVGTIFSLKQGVLSKPVEGTAGVFVVVVDKITEPAPVTDYNTPKSQATQQLQQRAGYEVFNALKEKANIVDNRGKYY